MTNWPDFETTAVGFWDEAMLPLAWLTAQMYQGSQEVHLLGRWMKFPNEVAATGIDRLTGMSVPRGEEMRGSSAE